MKIQCPQNLVTEGEGFSDENDIFKRKEFGESLSKIVQNSSGELVIALDANWGEGKSTFFQMWRNELAGSVPVLIYDAFHNDRARDPFLSIVSYIYELAREQDADEGKNILKHGKAVAKILLRAGMGIGLKAATAGVFDGTAVQELGVDDEIGDVLAENAEKLIEKRIVSVRSDELCVEGFKATLGDLAEKLSDSGKLVFVVDELDRCRPDYALDVLEVVKHFFSVEDVVFIFSVNRKQLEIAIQHRYGARVDANQYLQKFVGLWVTLPDGDLGRSNRRVLYIERNLNLMGFEANEKCRSSVEWSLAQMAQHYEMSLREIERLLTTFAVFFNEVGNEKYTVLYELGVLLSAIKVKYPMVFNKIASDVLSYQEIVEQAELKHLAHSNWEGREEDHRLRWVLKLYLMPDENKHKYLQENPYTDRNGYVYRDAVAATCRVLSSFGRYI